MRFSQMFIPTRKEDPAEAEVVSHKLLIRGAYMRMLARGIYTFMPLGWRSVKKIEEIVRQEMNAAGAQEVHMPAVQPSELWKESGRWEQYGPELLRFKDRKGSDFCVGPTHEEVITDLVRGEVTSYKQLPINLYQIQTKFRDEVRPRFGLMRGREFIMKDAYSFDLDEAGALKSYEIMFDTYSRICTRLGFEFRAVEADTGNIGGSRSHEFQVLAETGEDEIVSCPSCGYTANVEKAEITVEKGSIDFSESKALVVVQTPGQRTIEEVSKFLKKKPETFIKTLIFMADDKAVAILVRGDHEANELKVKAFLKTQIGNFENLRMAQDTEVYDATGAPVGFAGPVGLKIPVYADLALASLKDGVAGANQNDAHHLFVNVGRDYTPTAFADLRKARGGDMCGRCGGTFDAHRGIEVGHVFYLGTKYSAAMNATVLDEEGKARPMEMGCYGIGVTRMLAAIIEQNHDENGIIWPMAVAPFHVIVLPLQVQEPEVVEAAEKIYKELAARGVEVLLDDRDLRAGGKFKDADLIGIPLRITVGGRGLKEGIVEVKGRREAEPVNIAIADVVEHVAARVFAELPKV
jgi:prolyl-tRNA synthetase